MGGGFSMGGGVSWSVTISCSASVAIKRAAGSILYYYGCLLSLNENYIEAEVALKRVLRFEPDHVEAREELEKVERLQKSPQKHSLLSRWVGRKS